MLLLVTKNPSSSDVGLGYRLRSRVYAVLVRMTDAYQYDIARVDRQMGIAYVYTLWEFTFKQYVEAVRELIPISWICESTSRSDRNTDCGLSFQN